MEKRIICFSQKGREVAEDLNKKYKDAGIEPATVFYGFDFQGESAVEGTVEGTGKDLVDVTKGEEYPRVTIADFAKEGFAAGAALIFTGAVGIAVRAISSYVKDKLTDSPVVVIDDNGRFVIPLLAGHAGGANKIAATIAGLIGAIPVITTSTDAGGAFSADVFAAENALTIRNRDGIKKVSAKAVEGKPVTLSIKDYPPPDPVDIIIADETDREYSLLLSPKQYTIGIGLKKGKDPLELEDYVLSVLRDRDIDINDVYAVCTIDVKENERALRMLCDKYRLPLITFEASLLQKAQGDFTASDFVKETVGTDNVCERAAVLGGGPGAELIIRKMAHEGMTIAVAKRRLKGNG